MSKQTAPVIGGFSNLTNNRGTSFQETCFDAIRRYDILYKRTYLMNTEHYAKFANPRAWQSFLRNWGPAALWASIIFSLSTDSFSSSNTGGFLEPLVSAIFAGITAEQFELIHLLIRKLSHWSEYFIFSLLLIRAVHGRLKGKGELRRAIWVAAAVALYALSDEIHQVFVPSRSPSLADVTIDSFGGICGILWTYLSPKSQRPALNQTPDNPNALGFCKKT